MKLSVVIITYNEVLNIERCISSVLDIADEIIVVDSYSTDGTKEICQKYSVSFIEKKWSGYSDQKNHAGSLASNDWIFSIDADEEVSSELKNAILSIKESEFENVVFSVNRLTNYCGKWIRHCGWYPDTKIRIFNRNFVNWDDQIVHEELKIPGNFKIVNLKGDLNHYSYYTIGDHLRQTQKFTDLSAQQAVKLGKKAGIEKLILNPVWKFLRDYVIKMGFLDGKSGFNVCRISAYATYLKYKKIRDLNRKKILY